MRVLTPLPSCAGLVIRGLHVVSLDLVADAARAGKTSVQDVTLRHQVAIAATPAGTTPVSWAAAYKGTFSGLAAPLPANVHCESAAWRLRCSRPVPPPLTAAASAARGLSPHP